MYIHSSFYILALLAHAPFTISHIIPRSNNDGKPNHAVRVNTSSGIFAPYFPPAHPDIASFPDIPYAQNPTGRLRFSAPVAASPPPDGSVGYAEHLPLGCYQYVQSELSGTVSLRAGHAAAMFQRGDYANTTEDCLRLSIFAPKTATEDAISRPYGENGSDSPEQNGLPVIVWLHGGGYVFGGTNVPYQLAPNWVQRSQKHIVVQVQYRLNLLGLPNAAGLAASDENLNLSLLDQRLAVEWVRENIASLGGDPERITLWGESAGGYSADGYLFSWADDPIVSGVIADSGNALALEATLASLPPVGDYSQFSKAAARLGCGDLDASAELSCMRTVPSSDIQAYIQAPTGGGGASDDNLSFGTIIDNVTVFPSYASRIAKGSKQFPVQIPLLIGTNIDEGSAIVPYDFPGSETATSLPASLAPVAEDFKLGLDCTTLREVRLRSEAGAHTWQYLYAGNFTDVSPRPWLGAYHAAELPMVFGTLGGEGPTTGFERRVSRDMQDLYLAFAEDPVHGLSQRGWAPATGAVGRKEVNEWAAGGIVRQMVDVEDMRDECIKNGHEV